MPRRRLSACGRLQCGRLAEQKRFALARLASHRLKAANFFRQPTLLLYGYLLARVRVCGVQRATAGVLS